MLRSHTARGCSAGASSSSCSWVPTPACHALLGPIGCPALPGMVPSSQTLAPKGPQHHQAFVPKADLTKASEMDKFQGKDLLPRSPGLKTASRPTASSVRVKSTRLVPHLGQCDKRLAWLGPKGQPPGSWGGACPGTQPSCQFRIIIFQTPHLLPRIDPGKSGEGLITSKGHLPHTSTYRPGWASRPTCCSAPSSQLSTCLEQQNQAGDQLPRNTHWVKPCLNPNQPESPL